MKYLLLKSLISLLTLNAIITPLALGQNNVKKKEGRPVKILYYMAPKGAPESINVYSTPNKMVETSLPRHNFSDTFYIDKGDLKLSFREQPLGSEDKLYVGEPTVNIPASWKKILLLVSTDKKNPFVPISVNAIDASDDKFSGGSLYMINVSKVTIQGTVGDKKLNLKPSSSYTLKNPIKTNDYYPTKLAFKAPNHTRFRPFLKQMWKNHSNERVVMFFMSAPAPKHVRFYSAPIRSF